MYRNQPIVFAVEQTSPNVQIISQTPHSLFSEFTSPSLFTITETKVDTGNNPLYGVGEWGGFELGDSEPNSTTIEPPILVTCTTERANVL